MIYSLGENQDLSFLEERELEQVAIGVYQVIFNFDQNMSIMVEDRFEFSSGSEVHVWKPGATSVAGITASLLGEKVKKVRVGSGSSVELVFSGNKRLMLTPEKSRYESYQITHRGGSIIV